MGNASLTNRENEKSLFFRKSDSEQNEHRPPEPNMGYELNDEKLETIFSIIKTVMENTKCSFYGFQVIPYGLDALILFKTDMFTAECFERVLSEISELIINPIDELFVVQMRISDAIDIMDPDIL